MYIRKISKDSKIKIPKEIMKELNTRVVRIEMRDGEIVIKPIKHPAGALRKYTKRDKSIEEIMQIEKDAIKNFYGKKKLKS